MKVKTAFLYFLFSFFSIVSNAEETTIQTRQLAITIDDLPVQSTVRLTQEQVLNYATKFVSTIEELNIPVYGFAIGNKIQSQREAFQVWLDADIPMGNHSYSHPDLNALSAESYEADIAKASEVLGRTLTVNNQDKRYYRYPMLRRGNSDEKRARVAEYLKRNNYESAPVSIDNQEYVFSLYYDRAIEKNDVEAMKRIGSAYISYMESVFEFFELESQRILNYEPKQILLIHANALNRDYLDELVAMLKDRRYEIISLDEAMTDPFYAMKENYVGPRGLSWLHRIAATEGMDLDSEPREPQWLHDL